MYTHTLYTTCQFIYMRNCEVQSLNITFQFPVLRLLDISFNNLSSLMFLQYLPFLKHLYISTNNIPSIDNMPFMQHLEVRYTIISILIFIVFQSLLVQATIKQRTAKALSLRQIFACSILQKTILQRLQIFQKSTIWKCQT